MNRRSFLASIAALFAAPAAALGLTSREPKWSDEQLRGNLGNWPKNGFYGSLPPGASMYEIMMAEARIADTTMRRALAEKLYRQERCP